MSIARWSAGWDATGIATSRRMHMNKNEIIDAILACDDQDGITATGVFIEKFKALVRAVPRYRDVVVAPVVEPVAEPVVEAPVEPAA